MPILKNRKGELAILIQAVMWSIFPVVTILSYSTLGPLSSLSLSTFFSMIFFAAVLTYRRKWQELKRRDAWLDIALSALIIGILYYVLFFFGLKYTSPGNASLLARVEILFSYLFFNVWHKEEFILSHIAGSILMVIGAVIVLLPKTSGFHTGDLLVISAAFIAPFGNVFQRRAMKKIGSETITFARSFITTILILPVSILIGEHASGNDIEKSLLFLIINGVLLFGLGNILWLEGIHRISVTKANALSSVSPLLTILFAYLILKQPPQLIQLLAFLPLCAGLLLLTRHEQS